MPLATTVAGMLSDIASPETVNLGLRLALSVASPKRRSAGSRAASISPDSDEISARDLNVGLGFRGARINEIARMTDAFLTKLADAGTERLQRLGPTIQPGEIVASTDDVLVRRPEKRRWLELRTAYVRTADGYRYLSGTAQTVLQQLYLLLVLCDGSVNTRLTLLGDGARWIATFFTSHLATWPGAELILDWYHCRKKCYNLTSSICRGRAAKAKLLGQLIFQLWRGQVDEAVALLETYRPQTKNIEKLDELINYLQNRRAYIPNYKARRKHRKYIGSAHAEKGNDLIVSQRQKHRGMHWSQETSDALAALRTLMLNGGWDLYWLKQQVLPLAVPLGP